MILTDEQAEIQDAVATLAKGDNLKVIAFAGAGKTTTLTACAEARNNSGVYLAFNRGIADEAKLKLKHTRCKPMTIHSLALSVMKKGMLNEQVTNLNATTFRKYLENSSNTYKFPALRGWNNERIGAAVIRTITAYSASDNPDPGPEHAREAIISALGDPDFMLPGDKTDLVKYTIEKLSDPIYQMARDYYLDCLQNGLLNHDMYLKMLEINDDMRHEAFKFFKYIMIDEAQDINPVQRSILQKTGLPLVAVGDPYQQIYSWRGAENALLQLPGREMYLTQSFRFGKDIATIARCILDSIPDGGGPSQQLVGSGPEPKNKDDPEKIAIICRTNFGVLDEATKIFRTNNARDKGKNRIFVDNIDTLLADALSALALYENRMEHVNTPDLKQFNSWSELEVTAEEGCDPGLSNLVNLVRRDRIGDVRNLAENQKKQEKQGENVFKNTNVVICTAHRSKGLEYDRVKIADDFMTIEDMRKRYRGAQKKSAKHVTLAQEAYNTLYVAATRAKLQCSGHGPIFSLSTRNVRPDDLMTGEEMAAAYGERSRYGERNRTGNREHEKDQNNENTENNKNIGNDETETENDRAYEPF